MILKSLVDVENYAATWARHVHLVVKHTTNMGKYAHPILTPLACVVFLGSAFTVLGAIVFLAGDIILTLLGVVNK